MSLAATMGWIRSKNLNLYPDGNGNQNLVVTVNSLPLGDVTVDFSTITNLMQISLGAIGVTSFSSILPNSLSNLDLGGNPITSFTSILPNSLQRLSFYSGGLSSFTSILPDSLTYLNLANNQITSFTSILPDSLTYLNLANNQITSFTSILPNSLDVLDLANNRLTSFTQDVSLIPGFADPDVNGRCNLCPQTNSNGGFLQLSYPLPNYLSYNGCCIPPSVLTIPQLPCYCDSGLIQSYLDAYSAGNYDESAFPTIYCSIQMPDLSYGAPDPSIQNIAGVMFSQVFSYLLDISEELFTGTEYPGVYYNTSLHYSPFISDTDKGAIFNNVKCVSFYGAPGLPSTVYDPTNTYSLIRYKLFKLFEGITDSNAIDLAAGTTSPNPGVYYMTAENQAIANAVTGTTYKWAMLL